MSRIVLPMTLFGVLLLGATLTGPGAAHATTCGAEIDKAERQAEAISDPGKRQAIEALLRNAEREHVQGNDDRCLEDVRKAREAMGK